MEHYFVEIIEGELTMGNFNSEGVGSHRIQTFYCQSKSCLIQEDQRWIYGTQRYQDKRLQLLCYFDLEIFHVKYGVPWLVLCPRCFVH